MPRREGDATEPQPVWARGSAWALLLPGPSALQLARADEALAESVRPPSGAGVQARPEREAAEARAEAAEVAPRAAAARSAVVVPVTEEEAARRPAATVLAAAAAGLLGDGGRRWRRVWGRFNRSRCDILWRRRRLSLGLFGRLRFFGRRRRSFRGRGFRLNIDDHFVRRFGRFRLQRDDRERGDVERDDDSDDERT